MNKEKHEQRQRQKEALKLSAKPKPKLSHLGASLFYCGLILILVNILFVCMTR
jgi:hypothetical protein